MAEVTTLKDRVQERLDTLGIGAVEAATRAGLERNFIRDIIEKGKQSVRSSNMDKLAAALETTPDWLNGREERQAPKPNASFGQPNASPPIPVTFPNVTIGMFGKAAGGGLDDGKFILNGNRVMDVLCPPMLIGVQGAYGVFVHGNSMKPRYREGEAVFVNPHLPIRQEDYAVVQIAGEFEGDDSSGFVKQFVSRNSRELVMAQHQPPEAAEPEPYSEGRFLLRFPREKVIAVHRIVWAGEV